MPCNQTCGCNSMNNCTWVIILAFIIIWFFCGCKGGCSGNNGSLTGNGCGCNCGC